tara:strand:+ start:16617 stop:16838 length:222 start_codon:yes stop_codon:yes gene_type:complete
MNIAEVVAMVAELAEVDEAQVSAETVLEELEAWDSLAVVSFMAMVDESHGIKIQARAISAAKTVNDLLVLVSA